MHGLNIILMKQKTYKSPSKAFQGKLSDSCQIKMRWSVLHIVVNCVTPSTDDASLTTMAVLRSGGNVGRGH